MVQILSTKPDNFTPRIVKKTDDYIYVEYESGVLGVQRARLLCDILYQCVPFVRRTMVLRVSVVRVMQLVHDVEFWFPPSGGSLCEYRSASRIGPIDFDVNRKRIKVTL